ncbi:uncharacterized protein LOC116786334 [Chiroxiphia lanceolata]|uniref:uncharacterized protein LOC116786334 n=1 Tax=Chiroxiphia lanceolata TaxID=296741 RepID=UPI0013CEA5D0|nr:uncharacterized protein LOC116786334 [Chiroxiphia lanceolata]
MQCLDPIYSVPHHYHSISCIPPHCLQHPQPLAAVSWIPSAASHTTATQNPASHLQHPTPLPSRILHPAPLSAASCILPAAFHTTATLHPAQLPAASLIPGCIILHPTCRIPHHCPQHPSSPDAASHTTACTIPHPSPLPAPSHTPQHCLQHLHCYLQHPAFLTVIFLTTSISSPHPWSSIPHCCLWHPTPLTAASHLPGCLACPMGACSIPDQHPKWIPVSMLPCPCCCIHPPLQPVLPALASRIPGIRAGCWGPLVGEEGGIHLPKGGSPPLPLQAPGTVFDHHQGGKGFLKLKCGKLMIDNCSYGPGWRGGGGSEYHPMWSLSVIPLCLWHPDVCDRNGAGFSCSHRSRLIQAQPRFQKDELWVMVLS